jgi:hypothetical protein
MEDDEDGSCQAVKKRRGKSNEQKEHDKNHVYSTIQIKLNSVLQSNFRQPIHEIFSNVSSNISRITFEAYLLANLHVIRLIEEGKDLPTLNQSFFYSCCSLITDSTRNVGTDELNMSFDQYEKLRPSNWHIPQSNHLAHVMSSLTREMVTMTENHIVLNTFARLKRYVRLKYKLSDSRESNSFIRGCFMDTVLTDDQIEFKNWIQVNPCFENTIKHNINHFIMKLADISKYYATLEPGTKGVRSFTLLPMKGDYVGSFFLIDPSTLSELLKLLNRLDQERIIQQMMSMFLDDTDEMNFLRVRLRARAIFNRDFYKLYEIRKALWHTIFNVTKYETRRRKFAYKISTNGYAANVYLQVPKTSKKEEEEDVFDSLNGLNESDFERFIGIDPGKTYVCTAYAGEEDVFGKSQYNQVSTAALRFDSKMKERQQFDVTQRKRNPEYAKTIQSLPSLKIASFTEFKNRLKDTLEVAESLFTFQSRSIFKAWRFKVSVFGKKAMSKAARMIIGDDSVKPDKILIGYGDWSQPDGFKGKEKAPVKKIRKRMRQMGVKIILIDEHRTSMCCSKCLTGEVKNLSYEGKHCHEVVRCGNSESCNVVWHRDLNASRNIRSVLMTRIRKLDRPSQLKRQKRQLPL